MEENKYDQMTDEELMMEAKKLKSFLIVNALFVGFLVGIIGFSLYKNSWGMLTLIPLFLIYKLTNDPKNKKSEIASEAISRQKFKMVVQNFIHCFERVNRAGHKPQLLLKAKNKLFKKKHDNEISTV